jgi:hypothetical protein
LEKIIKKSYGKTLQQFIVGREFRFAAINNVLREKKYKTKFSINSILKKIDK